MGLLIALEKLRRSPLAAGYHDSQMGAMNCSARGYPRGPVNDSCFPGFHLWFDDNWWHGLLLKTSEPLLMNAYAKQHSRESLGQGMKELCDGNEVTGPQA